MTFNLVFILNILLFKLLFVIIIIHINMIISINKSTSNIIEYVI